MFSRLIALLALSLVVFVSASSGATRALPPAATTETDQTAWFSGVGFDTDYLVIYFASDVEGDPSPYALGTATHSNGLGRAKSVVSMGELAAFYGGVFGSDGPVYEVKVCLYATTTSALDRVGSLLRNPSGLALAASGTPTRLRLRSARAVPRLVGQAVICTPDTHVGYTPEDYTG